MIVEKIMAQKEASAKSYPCTSNRTSEIGHECLRYLCYCRTNWEDRKKPDARLQLIFDLGNKLEELIFADLIAAGVPVSETQSSFEWKKFQITGHIDGKVAPEKEAVPVEAKTMSPFAFAKVETLDDMKSSKYMYMRKYPAQLQIYMLMSNAERGVFLLKNKSTGEYKEIWVDLDLDYAENLLKKAEAVNKHIEEGTLPDPEYIEDCCDDCNFRHICTVNHTPKEVQIKNDPELEGILARHQELDPLRKEWTKLDGELKVKLNGVDKTMIGNFFITGKMQKTTRYDLPDEVKNKYKKESEYWKKIIRQI